MNKKKSRLSQKIKAILKAQQDAVKEKERVFKRMEANKQAVLKNYGYEKSYDGWREQP